jgi:archaemetzincin
MSSRVYGLLIVPVGRHPEEHIHPLCERLERIYRRVRCDVLRGSEVPEECYDSRMKAFVAKKVLSFLGENHNCKACERILGITDVDLCVNDSHLSGYLFGLARPAGKVALISSHRLHGNPSGKEHPSLLVERLIKEAMHELGHLFDLTHCHNKTCVMSGSKTAGGIDLKRVWYCLRCREHAGRRPDEDSVLSWIQPVIEVSPMPLQGPPSS